PVAPPLRHAGGVVDAEISADGRRVVAASSDHTARVWDVVSGRPAGPHLRHPYPLICASLSPDGGRVLTACGTTTGTWSCEARVWDAVTGRPTAPIVSGPGIVV